MVHLPLRLIRLVTDPIVDSVLLLISKLLVPPLLQFGQAALTSGLRIIAGALGQDRADKVAELSTGAVSCVLYPVHRSLNRAYARSMVLSVQSLPRS